MVGSLTGYKSLIDKIKDTKEFLLVPQEYFAGYTDYLKAIVFTFFNKPKVSKKIIFCNIEITDLVTGHLRKDYENNEVTNNRMYYYYTKGLLKNSKVENFIYLFENRAWERMSIVALRKYSSSTRIIGYVHSSVRQSFLAYFQGEEEKNLVPSPDRILTTGKEPRIMLRQAGNYGDKVKLSEACALRYEYFFANKRIERRKEGKILVTFPIEVSSSFKLLDFLNDTFSCNNEYRVVLRSHPFTPVEILLKKSSLKLSDNFEISNSVSLRQDLENSAVLIYVDSTSSMEALACGIPVIHVDLKGPLNHDPLFDLNSLKWTASNKEELLIAIDCISKMDNEEFLEKHSRAVSYLKEYFYPVQEDYLKEFIR